MQPKPEWTKPTFSEINMNAEIGGYQADDFDGNLPPHDAQPAASDAPRDDDEQ